MRHSLSGLVGDHVIDTMTRGNLEKNRNHVSEGCGGAGCSADAAIGSTRSVYNSIMRDEVALLAAIDANPAEDTPRLGQRTILVNVPRRARSQGVIWRRPEIVA
jgi:hypothetical protein